MESEQNEQTGETGGAVDIEEGLPVAEGPGEEFQAASPDLPGILDTSSAEPESEGEEDAAGNSETEPSAEEPAQEPPVAAPPASVPPGLPPPADKVGSEAVTALIEAYRELPGIVPGLIGGGTVDEVKASLQAAKKAYADVRASVLKEQGERVPPGHAGSGATAEPRTSIEMILAGVAASRR